jgi:hypothetical protein
MIRHPRMRRMRLHRRARGRVLCDPPNDVPAALAHRVRQLPPAPRRPVARHHDIAEIVDRHRRLRRERVDAAAVRARGIARIDRGPLAALDEEHESDAGGDEVAEHPLAIVPAPTSERPSLGSARAPSRFTRSLDWLTRAASSVTRAATFSARAAFFVTHAAILVARRAAACTRAPTLVTRPLELVMRPHPLSTRASNPCTRDETAWSRDQTLLARDQSRSMRARLVSTHRVVGPVRLTVVRGGGTTRREDRGLPWVVSDRAIARAKARAAAKAPAPARAPA